MTTLISSERTPNNCLWLDCKLWMNEDCRDIQLAYQLLDSKTKQPVGDMRVSKLNRAFVKWIETEATFYVDGELFTPASSSSELYEADAYVPISSQMLLLAIAQWLLQTAPPEVKFAEIKQLQCNAASWVRLHPADLTQKIKVLHQKDNRDISLNIYRAVCDINIERFWDGENV